MKKTIIILWILLTAVLGYGQTVREVSATTTWKTVYDTPTDTTGSLFLGTYFKSINLKNNSTSSADTVVIYWSMYSKDSTALANLDATKKVPVTGGESIFIEFVSNLQPRYVFYKSKSGTIPITLVCLP